MALAWMVGQAKLAGVKMLDNPSLHTTIASPVFHDAISNLISGADMGGPMAISEDRDVRYRNGMVEKQRNTTLGVMSYADTLQFIKYRTNPNPQDSIAGTVDKKGDLQWLNDHGHDIHDRAGPTMKTTITATTLFTAFLAMLMPVLIACAQTANPQKDRELRKTKSFSKIERILKDFSGTTVSANDISTIEFTQKLQFEIIDLLCLDIAESIWQSAPP